ncbi:DksA/TraR family C4-type zinc finger protein [Salinisphaera aquimarina]|uniref:DksA/TraR family C4-type zinc finger protein n=1 Tax=Salinisphaera aquimarina TaxID=2094031 RepID=A0ABV7EPA1_9GAMM
MATGWAKEGAVQEQIDSTVQDGVDQARRELEGAGESLTHCEECGEPIPERRRELIKGVRLCVACQSEVDKHNANASGFNRRGSKDSQLR